MAKKSSVEKNKNRRQLVAKLAAKRAELRKVTQDRSREPEERFEATLALAAAVPIPVIASGGLASLADVRRLLAPDCAILEGAISGRALYDGRLDGKEALRLVRAARESRKC